jgi:hypothetical protein
VHAIRAQRTDFESTSPGVYTASLLSATMDRVNSRPSSAARRCEHSTTVDASRHDQRTRQGQEHALLDSLGRLRRGRASDCARTHEPLNYERKLLRRRPQQLVPSMASRCYAAAGGPTSSPNYDGKGSPDEHNNNASVGRITGDKHRGQPNYPPPGHAVEAGRGGCERVVRGGGGLEAQVRITVYTLQADAGREPGCKGRSRHLCRPVVTRKMSTAGDVPRAHTRATSRCHPVPQP